MTPTAGSRWSPACPTPPTPSEDTCTQTSYAANTTSWLLDLPSEVIVTAVPPAQCPVSGTPTQGELVSDTRTFYDGSTTLGAAPSAGDVTMTQQATSYSGPAPVFTTQSTATYDEYGRVTSATDADNHTTTTSYTPATGAEPTSETVTDPMGLATTTTYDPARDLPLTVTNPAGWVTTETYDALGRLTGVWTPGHPQGTAPADKTFSYTVSDTAASVVTTNTITDTGGYLPSETLYDSLGRAVETQAQTPDGTGMDVSDTFYNSDGWPVLASSPYYVQYNSSTGIQLGTLVAAPDDQVPSQTGYVYDGDGRVTRQISYTFATETWETDTSYGGDYTTVVPPTGGTAQTTFTNGRGQHLGDLPVPLRRPRGLRPARRRRYDKTSYTYTPAQQLATITDAAGNQWSYAYNLAGDQTSATDPDAGTTTSTYDAAGQLMSVTDARGKQVSYTYDADGRKTAEYDTTGGAAESGSDELASWTYDTLAKGQPTSSTSYRRHRRVGLHRAGHRVQQLRPAHRHRDHHPGLGRARWPGPTNRGTPTAPTATWNPPTTTSAAGGLPAETVDTGYNTASQPVSLGSSPVALRRRAVLHRTGPAAGVRLRHHQRARLANHTYNQETGQLATAQLQTGVQPGHRRRHRLLLRQRRQHHRRSRHPRRRPRSGAVLHLRLPRPAGPGLVPGHRRLHGRPVPAGRSRRGRPLLGRLHLQHRKRPHRLTSTPAAGRAPPPPPSPTPPPGSAQPHAATTQPVTGPSGTTTTSYSYNADGRHHPGDRASTAQNLNWNDAGQLASAHHHRHRRRDHLLLLRRRRQPAAAVRPRHDTLYLPDEQLIANTATGTVTGTRYYTIGGVTVAARTCAGTIDYLIGDQQGTATLAIDSATLAVTRRYYDPYGNPSAPRPRPGPATEGFVGGTADTATGLTNLGAREYNPATRLHLTRPPAQPLRPAGPQRLRLRRRQPLHQR